VLEDIAAEMKPTVKDTKKATTRGFATSSSSGLKHVYKQSEEID
jgi:hypothetical protein